MLDSVSNTIARAGLLVCIRQGYCFWRSLMYRVKKRLPMLTGDVDSGNMVAIGDGTGGGSE